jgi:quercetin dioxygenase-like cupin family protein
MHITSDMRVIRERWDAVLDGPLTEDGLRAKLEARGYRVSRYVYPVGTVFSAHTHQVDKIDAVLSGRFRLVLEGDEIILEAGDCIDIPRGVVHSAEVVGPEPVVSLDAVRDN